MLVNLLCTIFHQRRNADLFWQFDEIIRGAGLSSVWRRRHTFDWDGRRIRQSEHYHVVATDRFEPRMTDAAEAKVLDRFRWWPVRELAHATERLTPLALAEIVTRYLTSGAPASPPDWDVLED